MWYGCWEEVNFPQSKNTNSNFDGSICQIKGIGRRDFHITLYKIFVIIDGCVFEKCKYTRHLTKFSMRQIPSDAESSEGI